MNFKDWYCQSIFTKISDRETYQRSLVATLDGKWTTGAEQVDLLLLGRLGLKRIETGDIVGHDKAVRADFGDNKQSASAGERKGASQEKRA